MAAAIADRIDSCAHVCLDRWDVTLGGNLAHYMERAADDTYRVIAVVSETYSSKCNDRSGGAGVEAQMLSARLYDELDSDAVIPIIRNNPKNPPELPAFLSGRLWQTSETPPRRKLHTNGSYVTFMEWRSMPRRLSDRIRSRGAPMSRQTWLSETHLEGGTVPRFAETLSSCTPRTAATTRSAAGPRSSR